MVAGNCYFCSVLSYVLSFLLKCLLIYVFILRITGVVLIKFGRMLEFIKYIHKSGRFNECRDDSCGMNIIEKKIKSR